MQGRLLRERYGADRAFPERSGMERRRSCAPRGNGTLERSGAGRRSGMQRSKGKARSGGREKIEPETVPVEPAEPGRPEADQRSTMQDSRQSLAKRVWRDKDERRNGRSFGTNVTEAMEMEPARTKRRP